MRIRLSSSSSEGSQDETLARNGQTASSSSRAKIGSQSPLVAADGDQHVSAFLRLPSTLAAQGALRRRSHHLERITALRSSSKSAAGEDGTRAQPTRLNSKGPSWMQDKPPEASTSNRARPRVTFAQDVRGEERESEETDSSSSIGTADSEDDELEDWVTSASSERRSSLQSNGVLLGRSAREASLEAQDVASRIRLGAQDTHTQSPARRITSVRLNSPSDARQRSQPATVTSPRQMRKADDFDEVQTLLERMRIKKQEDETQERHAFETRNKALWDSIEKGIQEAEKAREAAIKEEQERARRVREQQEAVEKRAREAREAEEKQRRDAQEAEERKKQEEEQRSKAKIAEEAKAAQEKAAAEAKERSASGMGNGLVRDARQEYEVWASKMAHIKQNILPAVSNNAEWRKQCFLAKRQITRGIGQLTNSREEIVRITGSIHEVLTQARGASPGGEIYTWILNHLSKCLIRQAEQETAAKQDTAFPLARVAVWLLLEGHAELGDVLFARLVKKCCWILAFCPAKKAGEEELAYSKRLGKASMEESSQQHVARMSGAEVDKTRIPSHFRIGALWTWQARSIAPSFLEHALTPALWSVLLEIAGPRLLQAYGRQTGKIWALLHREGLQNGKAGFTTNASANSAKVRLQLLLEDWSRTSRVESCTSGREMDA